MPLLQRRCPWPASLVNLSGSLPKQHLGRLIVCLHSSVCLFVSYLFSQTASSWEQGLACIAHFTLSALHCTEKASTENTKTRRRGACRQSASSKLSDTYSSAGGWLHSAVMGRKIDFWILVLICAYIWTVALNKSLNVLKMVDKNEKTN